MNKVNTTSFSRQLNFYVFRKILTRAIYKDDYKENAKDVTFYNKHFHCDKPELLKEIKRMTNRSQNALSQQQEQQKELETLRVKVDLLESMQKIQENDCSAALEALILSGTQRKEADALDKHPTPTIEIGLDSISLMMNQSQPKRQESPFTLRGISASSIGDELAKLSAFDKKLQSSAEMLRNKH